MRGPFRKTGVDIERKLIGPVPISLAAALALLAAALTAPAFADSQTVRFWTALPEPDHAVMSGLVEQYNQQHPDTPVDYQNFPSNPDLYQALQQSDPPNLALIDSAWIRPLQSKLFPAEDILEQTGEMVKAVAKADTFKSVWNACTQKGRAYAIPFSAETAALALNPTYFKKIPPTAAFWQWQKTAVLVKKRAARVSPAALSASWNDEDLGRLWTFFAYADSKTPPALTLHDEEAALNVWWNWANRWRLLSLPETSGPGTSFKDSAMWLLLPRDAQAFLAQHAKFVVRPLPKLKKPWTFLRVEALGFFGGSRAWDFANYLTDYPQIKAWAVNTATVPVNTQVYLSPDYIQDMDRRRPWMRVFIGALSRNPKGLQLSEERLIQTGRAVRNALAKKLTVQGAAALINGALNGAEDSP